MEISKELMQEILTMRTPSALRDTSGDTGPKKSVGVFECREDLINFIHLTKNNGESQIKRAKTAGVSVGTVNAILKVKPKDERIKRLNKLWQPTNPFGHGVTRYDEL